MLIEIISLVVSYLGVFIGLGLSRIAKEEIVPGIKNLNILKKVIFGIALIWFFAFVDMNILYKLIAAALFVILDRYSRTDYPILGLIFGLQPSFVTAVIVFLYGFPTGSLMFKSNPKEVFIKTYIYLIFGAIGFALSKFIIG